MCTSVQYWRMELNVNSWFYLQNAIRHFIQSFILFKSTSYLLLWNLKQNLSFIDFKHSLRLLMSVFIFLAYYVTNIIKCYMCNTNLSHASIKSLFHHLKFKRHKTLFSNTRKNLNRRRRKVSCPRHKDRNALTIKIKAPFLMTSSALTFGHLQGIWDTFVSTHMSELPHIIKIITYYNS
jgi:hypothetical protein